MPRCGACALRSAVFTALRPPLVSVSAAVLSPSAHPRSRSSLTHGRRRGGRAFVTLSDEDFARGATADFSHGRPLTVCALVPFGTSGDRAKNHPMHFMLPLCVGRGDLRSQITMGLRWGYEKEGGGCRRCPLCIKSAVPRYCAICAQAFFDARRPQLYSSDAQRE